MCWLLLRWVAELLEQPVGEPLAQGGVVLAVRARPVAVVGELQVGVGFAERLGVPPGPVTPVVSAVGFDPCLMKQSTVGETSTSYALMAVLWALVVLMDTAWPTPASFKSSDSSLIAVGMG